jgi:phosphoribosylformimino-5-aminoimidazole carboxamide ribotide isomerase
VFQDAGCQWLHLVDLNGAFAGAPVNGRRWRSILDSTDVPTQLGGGIRDMATIETWLEKGITRVILGTVAVENPDLVRQAARAFPGRVAVGLDARGGLVATKGWAEQTDVAVTDLARAFEDAGVAAIIYTDIDRDGRHAGAQCRRDRGAGAGDHDPRDRLGRGLLSGRSDRAPRHGRDFRRDLGPGAL